MRRSTIVWAKFESVGKPHDTKRFHGDVMELLKTQALWLLHVYMGSKIRITIARTEEELDQQLNRAGISDLDMAADLEAMFDGVAERAEQAQLALQNKETE